LREAGREPMLSSAISRMGVALKKVVGEARRLVHQRAVGRHAGLRELRRGLQEGGRGAAWWAAAGGLQRGGDQGFQVAPADLGVGVLGADDLALLGQADLAAHRARGLRQDGLVAGAAAAPHGAAAAVEHAQADAGRCSSSNSATSAISARYSSQLLVKMPPSLLLSE
jgi:hypothetical protein